MSFGEKQAINDIYEEFDHSGMLKKHLLDTFKILLTLRKFADADHKGRSWSDTVKLVIGGQAAAVFIGDFARSEIAYFGK